ncbi:hypothetical protein LTR37_000336 [Vermiconidia calcicola]|uniref:Uncharacterized protein n=1 Tax=Vermiconidia calcicola TaxID=1690605 RepID=A0ACC3NYJ6_9PEZI|nr:hypothetical protein LTR37_000336 [Vermiconidia calcicola]
MVTPPPGRRIFPLRAPKTPKVGEVTTRRDGINNFFRTFNEDYGIALPYNERESPSKRRKSPGHDAMKRMSFLYYQDPEGLAKALQQFRSQSPTLNGNDEKLNYLLDQLTLTVTNSKQQGTPRSKGQWPPPAHSLPHNAQHELDAPPSPTLSVKHAPKATPDVVRYPELPPAMAGSSRNVSHTSHTSFTTAHTSFDTSANTSFWSEAPQKGSQAPTSPATSVDSFDGAKDAPDCTQTSAYDGPMSSMDEAQIAAIVSAAPANTSPLTKYALSSFDRTTSDGQDNVVRDLTSSFRGVKTAHMLPPPLPPQISRQDTLMANPLLKNPEHVLQHHPAPLTNTPVVPKPIPTDHDDSKLTDVPEHVRVKKIPEDGLTSIILPESFHKLPMYLRVESHRVIQACKLDPSELDGQWNPKTLENLHAIAKAHVPGFRCGPKISYKNHSLCLKMRYSKSKDGPLLETEVLRPRLEMPNNFQRKFDSTRIMFLDVDPLSKLPQDRGLNGQKENVSKRFPQLLAKPQKLFGRTWVQLHAQPKKPRKKGKDADSKAGGMQFIFVDLSGDGDTLQDLTLREVIDFSLQLSENLEQSWCKAYARLDLSASRTHNVLDVLPHEVGFVPDTYAKKTEPEGTFEPEDTQFNDPKLEFSQVFVPKTVMNDGCSKGRAWVFRAIAQAQGLDHIPAAAQVRIAGSKGMISMDRVDAGDDEARPAGQLFQITKSQSKVKLKPENRDPDKYDPLIFALGIVKVSSPLHPSYLYLDFLPILVDRGVSPKAIEDLVRKQADVAFKELEDALGDRDMLRDWIFRQFVSGAEDRRHENGVSTLAGFPKSRAERAVHMLESGFEHTKFQPLATEVYYLLKNDFDRRLKSIRVQLPQSTMALVVTDNEGILKPGEVHLKFSNPFQDSNGWPLTELCGPVLVARNPSARPSDIQKVMAVVKPELGHIRDVLVVSERGIQPLLDKLSGGDYDGDTVWACWADTLVNNFTNAPPPRSLPDPRSLGIKVDDKKLKDVIGDINSEEDIHRFVQMGTANRMKPNQLGLVTKTLGRLVHKENSLSSQSAKALADLKDLLMDSDKNGRTFPDDEWQKFRKQHNLIGLPKPAYFNYTGTEEDVENAQYAPPKQDNIIDRIYFWVLTKIFDKTLNRASQILPLKTEGTACDTDLSRLYEQMLSSAPGGSAVATELADLRQKLLEVSKVWQRRMGVRAGKTKISEKQLDWDSAVVTCRNAYLDVQPNDETHPVVFEWVRQSGHALTTWDLLKASALAKFHFKGLMWFSIAGSELCLLKTQAFAQTRTLLSQAYLGMGVRKRKRLVQVPRAAEDVEWFDANAMEDVDEELGDDVAPQN